MSVQYWDYRFRFTDLPRALSALAALRTAGILSASGLPTNMLGDPRDADGAPTSDFATMAFGGRRGISASSYTDDTGATIQLPARGDPDYWYIHIRSDIDPATLPLDPASYGLIPSDPDESASVLGVWA